MEVVARNSNNQVKLGQLKEYFNNTIGELRFWIEICEEEDGAPAFVGVVMGILHDAICVAKENKLEGIVDEFGKMAGAVMVGKFREADEILTNVQEQLLMLTGGLR